MAVQGVHRSGMWPGPVPGPSPLPLLPLPQSRRQLASFHGQHAQPLGRQIQQPLSRQGNGTKLHGAGSDRIGKRAGQACRHEGSGRWEGTIALERQLLFRRLPTSGNLQGGVH